MIYNDKLRQSIKRAMLDVSRSRNLERPIPRASIDKIRLSWASKREHTTLWDFSLQTLSSLMLHDFYLYLVFMGVPVWRNPRYRDMIDSLVFQYFKFERGDDDAKPIFVIKICRGLMKSTIAMYFSAWVHLRKAILYKESTHALIGHGNDNKCADNMRLLHKIINDERLQLIYTKYLTIVTENSLNIMVDMKWAKVVRREVNFSTVTPNKDPAGVHTNLAVIDDWATYENTKTHEASEENKRRFYALFSLDDHSKGSHLSLFMLYVCTPYSEDAITEEIVEKDFTSVYEAPCSTQLFDPVTTKEEDLLWPEILSLKKLRFYYDTMSERWFRSQYDMVPYSREKGLNFKGELPPFDHSIAFSEERAYCVITNDPSRSKANRKSQAVVLVHIIDRSGHVHTIDGVSTFGMRPSEHAKWIFDFADRYKADMAIVETVHYQIALHDMVEEMMEQSPHKFQLKKHVHRQNKAEHYKQFLEPLLAQGRWHVNPILNELLKQIRGNSSLDDQIDCTSFLSEINIRSYAALGGYKPPSEDPMADYLKMNRHSHIINKQREKNEKDVCYKEIGW